MTTILTVNSAASLLSAIRALQSTGGEIIAKPGSYGAITISGARPAAEIKIGGTGAQFERIKIAGCRNLTLAGLDLRPAGDVIWTGGAWPFLIDVDRASDHIAVIDCNLRSTANADQFGGWALAEWKKHQVSGILMAGAFGIVARNSLVGIYHGYNIIGTDCLAEGNRAWGFAGDALRVQGDRGTVRGNWLTDAYHINPQHPDAIQAFETGGVLDGVVIEDNLLIEWTDPATAANPLRAKMQQIGMHNGPYGSARVIGNVGAGTSLNACHIVNAQGVAVDGNTFFTMIPAARSKLRLVGCAGAQVTNNRADAFVACSGAKPDPAKLAQFLVPAMPGAARPDLKLAR